MKNFDCVEMKRKGAECIEREISVLSKTQQLKYWKQGETKLREMMAHGKV